MHGFGGGSASGSFLQMILMMMVCDGGEALASTSHGQRMSTVHDVLCGCGTACKCIVSIDEAVNSNSYTELPN